VRGAAARPPEALVIGGGFAGLAAATALAEEGIRVLLLEARPHLGGRARSWIDPDTGAVVDNGQHLFLGCYRETIRLLERIGAAGRLEIQPRLEVPFVEPGGRVVRFRLPPLPSPWNLAAGFLRFPGLALRDRLGLLRVTREVKGRSRVRPAPGAAGGAAPAREIADLDDRTVSSWLASLGQSARAGERLWYPLAIAALNEDPERASAAMFLPVLREAFRTGAAGFRIGIPRVGLSDLYVEPAVRFLRSRGCEVRLRTQVRQVLIEGGRCTGILLPDGYRLAADAVVAATPPPELLEMLPSEIAADPFFSGVARLEASPIVSVYLWFGSPVTDLAFTGLIGGTWQWLFNRKTFAGKAGGAHGVTLVRSAARALVDRPRDALVRSALEEVHAFFPQARRANLRASLVVKERRAALAPLRGTLALRPPCRTPFRGLHLAGDWTATGLPATVEGAVWSGHACALQVREDRGSLRGR
jgi:zeta-carotene desaturase